MPTGWCCRSAGVVGGPAKVSLTRLWPAERTAAEAVRSGARRGKGPHVCPLGTVQCVSRRAVVLWGLWRACGVHVVGWGGSGRPSRNRSGSDVSKLWEDVRLATLLTGTGPIEMEEWRHPGPGPSPRAPPKEATAVVAASPSTLLQRHRVGAAVHRHRGPQPGGEPATPRRRDPVQRSVRVLATEVRRLHEVLLNQTHSLKRAGADAAAVLRMEHSLGRELLGLRGAVEGLAEGFSVSEGPCRGAAGAASGDGCAVLCCLRRVIDARAVLSASVACSSVWRLLVVMYTVLTPLSLPCFPVEQHLSGNKTRNAVVRLDTPLAKSEQQREQEEALAKYHQRVIEQCVSPSSTSRIISTWKDGTVIVMRPSVAFREQYDAQVAKQLAARMDREEQLRRAQREQQDEEMARHLQVGPGGPGPGPVPQGALAAAMASAASARVVYASAFLPSC